MVVRHQQDQQTKCSDQRQQANPAHSLRLGADYHAIAHLNLGRAHRLIHRSPSTSAREDPPSTLRDVGQRLMHETIGLGGL